MLHIGTHFVLRPGHVERSWLLLGDGQRFGLADMARLDLRGQRLVTLSACETGMPAGDATDGRQIDGLASAVLGAGARQVLASLWRVDDQTTARFMQVFYEEGSRAASQRGSAGTPDLAVALQRTQARLLAGAGSRASDWAAFVLMEAR
jgi:CHAT domain-containing protein